MSGGVPAIAPRLLAWFDRARRDLPWRRRPSPYRTLVSEFMLQQTVVATVIPYFDRFMARWPDLPSLARASEDQVTAMWSGLGYYARARNLHRVARAVVERHGGALPGDEPALRALPGIGPYTAAAIGAIAFGRPTFALDGNAARVMARLAGVTAPIDQPATRERLRAIGQAWTPRARAGAFVEAVMELGATVCTPRAPACAGCPLHATCEARRTDRADAIPVKSPRRPKRVVHIVCARVRARGRVLLVRRATGLLAGTWGLPARDVTAAQDGKGDADGGRTRARAGAAAARAALREIGVAAARARAAPTGSVRHVFTHRDVTADVFDVALARPDAVRGGDDLRWVDEARLDDLAVSSFLRKLLAA